MAIGYQQVSSYNDGDVIASSLFNADFNALQNAFSATTGHNHDGTAGGGAPVPLIADADTNNKIEIDGTNNVIKMFVEVGGTTSTEILTVSESSIIPAASAMNLGSAANPFGIVYSNSLIIDTDTLVVDSVNNRIGVNVAAPTEALDISGNINASGDLNISGTVAATGLTLDTNTLVVDGVNDRVGINTSSPNNTLSIESSGDTSLEIKSAADTDTSLILFTDGTSNSTIGQEFKIVANHSDSTLRFQNHKTINSNTTVFEPLRLGDFGKVAIGMPPGSSVPSAYSTYAAYVNGNLRASNLHTSQINAETLYVEDGSNVILSTADPSSYDCAVGIGVLATDSANDHFVTIEGEGSNTWKTLELRNDVTCGLTLNTTNHTGSSALRLSSGYVLHLQNGSNFPTTTGNAGARVDIGFSGVYSGACIRAEQFIDASSNYYNYVSIGGHTPTEKLDVDGNIKASGTIATGGFTLPSSDGSNGQSLVTDGSGNLSWTTISGGGGSTSLATDTTLGTIKLFNNTDQTIAANSVSNTASRTYGIQLNSSDQAVVNVPWTDTTYTVGDGGLTTNDFTNADHTKLNGIEANATADQTGAEIKTAYEAESDTNAFTDAEKTKLSNIEATADVTDTVNVTAAGALMDSEVTNLAQVKAFDSSDYATSAQGTTADNALPKAGGQMTGNITFSGTETVDGRNLSVDGAKLDNIEALADVTDATNVAAAGAAMLTGANFTGNVTTTGSVSLGQGTAGVYTLPTADGTAGQALVTDGNGNVTFGTVSGGSGGGESLAQTLAIGDTTSGNDINFGDNDKAVFGAGSDMEIYHDGTTWGNIDVNTGGFYFRGNAGFAFAGQNAAGTNPNQMYISTQASTGTVTLFHNGSSKLATSVDGVIITDKMQSNAVEVENGTGTSSALRLLSGNNIGTMTKETSGNALALFSNSNTGSAQDMRFAHGSGGESFRVTSTKNVGIGTSIPSEKLHVVGNIVATGNITAYYSDERLKDLKGTIPNALDRVNSLNGYYYTANDTARSLGVESKGVEVGVSAQEVANVLPEIVTDSAIGKDYKTVQYEKLTPLLIEAVKELAEKVSVLETKIKEMEK